MKYIVVKNRSDLEAYLSWGAVVVYRSETCAVVAVEDRHFAYMHGRLASGLMLAGHHVSDTSSLSAAITAADEWVK